MTLGFQTIFVEYWTCIEMSKKLLNQLLEEAITVISKDIREELNLQETTATFTPWVIKDAVVRQLQFTSIRNYKNPDGSSKKQVKTAKFQAWRALSPEQKKIVKEKIDTMSRQLMGDLLENYRRLKINGVTIVVNGNPDRFTVTTLVDDPSKVDKVWRGRGLVDLGSFQAIKEGYRDILNTLWADIAKYVQELSGIQEKDSFRKAAFNLEHSVGETVADKRVSSGISNLYSKIKAQVGSEKAAKQVFKELGLEFYIKYVSTDGSTSAKVFVGSASKNKRQSLKEREIIANAKDALSSAIITKLAVGSKIESWSGSDNRIEIERKKIVESFNNALSKKAKVKSINTKRNLSKTQTKKKKVSAKVKTKTLKIKPLNLITPEKVLSGGRRSVTSSKSNVALQALLNAKLPAKVMETMGSPRLINRTGRFARSVRVEEITTTPQGFPSIGYTYQKYPYQTFEPGFKQGDPDKDPRKLIDKSLRELAVGLIVGRFYTRRI